VNAPRSDTDHAALLRHSVASFIADEGGVSRARRLRASDAEYERAAWTRMAALGWIGVLIPERYGGSGLGLAEAAIIAEELAVVLAPEPFTAAAVLATTVLLESGNEALKARELPRLADGRSLVLLAWQEEAATLDAEARTTRIDSLAGAYRLNGVKRYVSGAAGADAFLVSARHGADQLVCWVDRGAEGLALGLERTADGRHFGTLNFTDVAVAHEAIVATGAPARAALELALDHGTVSAAAELCGLMGRTLANTLEYLRTRVQFGKPIGSFQALQHRAVDLLIQRELSAATLDAVLRELERNPEATARAALASRVKARCSSAALKVTREAIQLHGAIAFTDECDVGLYVKRALVLAAWLGTAGMHRRRYARYALQERV
jgi:alkylation response protein AidB-like acyl-CoA dehydrogenase